MTFTNKVYDRAREIATNERFHAWADRGKFVRKRLKEELTDELIVGAAIDLTTYRTKNPKHLDDMLYDAITDLAMDTIYDAVKETMETKPPVARLYNYAAGNLANLRRCGTNEDIYRARGIKLIMDCFKNHTTLLMHQLKPKVNLENLDRLHPAIIIADACDIAETFAHAERKKAEERALLCDKRRFRLKELKLEARQMEKFLEQSSWGAW